MNYPLTFAAAKRAEKSQWAIGDALLEEIGPPHKGLKQDTAFNDCAAELAEEGLSYSTNRLRDLRDVAYAFDLDRRRSKLGVEAHREAQTPQMLDKAEHLAEAEGADLTTRYIRKVKKASKKQDRKKKGAPERDKSRVTKKADNNLRRTINLTDIEIKAMKASKLGREFAEAIAGFELSRTETDDLRENVQKVLVTWQAVLSVIDNPLAKEVEAYLEAMS